MYNEYGKLFADGRNLGEIKKDEILHIGDNFATDYCGAKAYGWNALNLDRSRDPNIRQYQDWIVGPDYDGKSEEEILANTVGSLDEVTMCEGERPSSPACKDFLTHNVLKQGSPTGLTHTAVSMI